MRQNLLNAWLVAAVATVASGCSAFGGHAPEEDPRWRKSVVEFEWLMPAEVDARCKEVIVKEAIAKGRPVHEAVSLRSDINIGGCATVFKVGDGPEATSLCKIRAVKPGGFDDSLGLYVIGHEVLHCLGGVHD